MNKRKRWDVLVDLLKNRSHYVGAEIGVWKGSTTRKILDGLPGIKKFYAIDPWLLYEGYQNYPGHNRGERVEKLDKIASIFMKSINKYNKKVIVIRKTSEQASFEIPDNYLDFVFIDGNHDYEYIKQDIELWFPKVKTGGLFSGHDYNRSDGQSMGVKKAVDEVFDNINIDDNYVWWLTK